MQNTESVADTQNLISDLSELPNGDLDGNPEILVTELSHETITQNQPHSSTVRTTTRYGQKVKPPNRYAPGTTSKLSYILDWSEFNEIGTLAYHSDYVDKKLPKSIEEAFSSPEGFMRGKRGKRGKRNTTLYRKLKIGTSLKCQEEKNLVTGKWHFALKRKSKRELIRHKSRYVARGFKQKQGVDYDQTYSTTVEIGNTSSFTEYVSSKRNEIETVRHKNCLLERRYRRNFF